MDVWIEPDTKTATLLSMTDPEEITVFHLLLLKVQIPPLEAVSGSAGRSDAVRKTVAGISSRLAANSTRVSDEMAFLLIGRIGGHACPDSRRSSFYGSEPGREWSHRRSDGRVHRDLSSRSDQGGAVHFHIRADHAHTGRALDWVLVPDPTRACRCCRAGTNGRCGLFGACRRVCLRGGDRTFVRKFVSNR